MSKILRVTIVFSLILVLAAPSAWAASSKDDGKYAKQVSADLTSGGRMGITGTPAFELGLTDPKDPNKAKVTEFISGAQSLEKFSQVIEDLLKQAGKGKKGLNKLLR